MRYTRTQNDQSGGRRAGFVRLLTVGIVVFGLLAFGAPAVPPPQAGAAPPDPQVHWSPCGDGFECAVANVPLDHEGAQGGTIQLALIRLPASDPDERIGSLFLNPGGPGGSGVDLVRARAAFFPEEVRERYDLVGFDPRGIARSTPARCFGAMRQALETLAPLPFPVTEDEQALWEESDRELADACDQRGRRILDHMTTADVARDLDVLRAAVGDERLHYLGMSYGSYLGTTYANMFPDRVGRVVIDGVVDPVAWSTGHPDQSQLPFSTRLRSHEGTQDTLEEFFELCDAAAHPDAAQPCLFGPQAEPRFETLAAALRDAPVDMVLPDGTVVPFTYAMLINLARGAMYEPFIWPAFAELLFALEQVTSEAATGSPPAELGARFAALDLVTKRGRPAYRNFVEALPAVACTDSDNPDDYAAWPAAAAQADAGTDNYFGSPWTWLSSVCAFWPGEGPNRYTGPWDADTVEPVLVVNPLFDPATPYHGAQVVNDLLPNTHLLTYAGWGHVALGRTACVDETIIGYLLGDNPGDVTCPAAPSPFDMGPPNPPPPPGDGAGFPSALRTATTRD